ncbi:hypothetical protein QL996_04455 [Planococcus sp. APC 4015]|nr:hypothetical protein [Planococcus sp. APC 4015]
MHHDLADEDAVTEEIIERLKQRFPHTPTDTVAQAVTEAREHFARAKVRDFVPVLVEREARARLERPI